MGFQATFIAIRGFVISPEGELLRFSMVFVQWIHHSPYPYY